MRTSRRELVKWITASGIVLSLSRLASAQQPPFAARERLPGRGSWNPAATGMGRIDGVPKVTGAKLYASDFRAADLPGWPAYTSHAILVRAPDATHVYDAFDQARLALRDGHFVRFGEEIGPVAMPDYGAYRFTRLAGPTPDIYSPLKEGWVSPAKVDRDQEGMRK